MLNWCDPSKEPLSKHAKPLLILIGVHARLSNIDDAGYFIEDEVFEFEGVPVLRKAGTWGSWLVEKLG